MLKEVHNEEKEDVLGGEKEVEKRHWKGVQGRCMVYTEREGNREKKRRNDTVI